MKLVRREDNPNKKILMYIPYVLRSYRLFGGFFCKFERDSEVGGVIHQQVGCVDSECKKFQQWSGDSNIRVGKILASELGLRVGEISLTDRMCRL